MIADMIAAAKEEDVAVVLFARSENKKDQTVWLSIAYPNDKTPDPLLVDLNKAGWTPRGMLSPIIQDGVTVLELTAEGTGPNNTFVGNERRNALQRARRVLKKHYYEEVEITTVLNSEMM